MIPMLTNTGSGPELTKMQQAFVTALVSNGGDKEAAAVEAGYSPKTARRQAYELLAKPHVMAALMAQTATELASHAPRASHTLTRLLEGKSEYVRLEAANSLLDRIGMRAPEKVDHRVSGDIKVHIDLG